MLSSKLDGLASLTVPLLLEPHHELTERWALMAGTTWTNWSVFREIRVNYQHDAQPDTVQPENWVDTWRTAIGTSLSWTMRGIAGVMFLIFPNAQIAEVN